MRSAAPGQVAPETSLHMRRRLPREGTAGCPTQLPPAMLRYEPTEEPRVVVVVVVIVGSGVLMPEARNKEKGHYGSAHGGHRRMAQKDPSNNLLEPPPPPQKNKGSRFVVLMSLRGRITHDGQAEQ